MATWHQQQRPVRLWSETHWVVVIDPPHEPRNCYLASSYELAKVYRRNLKMNNPHAYRHSYILKPQKVNS